MVIWVGGEGQYLRQNVLNMSLDLGLDISADGEKERGRIRSFDEHETELFKRITRELFRDIPYLLIIDNHETEKEWWVGKETSSYFDEPFWENNKFLLKVLIFCMNMLDETKNHLPLRMLLTGVRFAPSPVSANLLAAAASHMSPPTNNLKKQVKNANFTFLCCRGLVDCRSRKKEQYSALVLVKLGLARRSNGQPGCCIMFHPITQSFARRKGGLLAAQATIQSIRQLGNPYLNLDHLWASTFLVFGFKSIPRQVQLTPSETVQFIKKTALPLAIHAFTTFSRCNAALDLLKICTNAPEEVEKSFASQINDWCHKSLCWKKKQKSNLNPQMDEYIWIDATLLKATLLETRAKLLK